MNVKKGRSHEAYLARKQRKRKNILNTWSPGNVKAMAGNVKV